MIKQEHIDFIIDELKGRITRLNLESGWVDFTCRGLRGTLVYNENGDRPNYSNHLFIDRIDCFDKISKCVIQVKIPSNRLEKKILDSYLKFIRLPASYHFSNNYQYIENYNLDVTYYRDILTKILNELNEAKNDINE